MFDSMNQAKNAIQVYNAALSIHNANIANMSVVGYKRLDVSFQSVLEKVSSLGSPAASFANIGGTNPIQYGQGVGLANVSVDLSQGAFAQSSSRADLAIDGRGFFIFSDDGGTTYKYSRAGKFHINSAGSMVNDTGMQVYGMGSGGGLTPITGLTGSLTDYSWNDGTGELLYQGDPTGYRIALTYFNNPSGLLQASGTTFVESMASGRAATPVSSGAAAGNIKGGNIEQSNVFYLGESIDALEIQRAMSANLTTVRAASDMISQFISKLG